MGRCTYVKPDGSQCKAGAGEEHSMCISHDPTRRRERYNKRRAAAAGARRRAKKVAKEKAQAAEGGKRKRGRPPKVNIALPEGGFESSSALKAFVERCMLAAARGEVTGQSMQGITAMSRMLMANFFAGGEDEPADTPDELKKLSNRELHAWMAERIPTPILEEELEKRSGGPE